MRLVKETDDLRVYRYIPWVLPVVGLLLAPCLYILGALTISSGQGDAIGKAFQVFAVVVGIFGVIGLANRTVLRLDRKAKLVRFLQIRGPFISTRTVPMDKIAKIRHQEWVADRAKYEAIVIEPTADSGLEPFRFFLPTNSPTMGFKIEIESWIKNSLK